MSKKAIEKIIEEFNRDYGPGGKATISQTEVKTVTLGVKAFDVLVDRAEKYKVFAEGVISALGQVFPDTAEYERGKLEALKKELGDE